MKKRVYISAIVSLAISSLSARTVTQEIVQTTSQTVSYEIIDKGNQHPPGGGGGGSGSGSHHSGGGGGGHHHHTDRRTAISISSYEKIDESEADERVMKFYVRLSKKLDRDVRIDYDITPLSDTLSLQNDIVMPSGHIDIPSGHRGANISIRVKNDKLVEGDESFLITLHKPDRNFKFWRKRATGVIVDDEIKLEDIDLNGNYSVKEHARDDGKISTKIVNQPFLIDISAKEGFEILTDKKYKSKKVCSDEIRCYTESYGDNGVAKECKQDCTITTTVALEYSDKMDIDKVILHSYDEYDDSSRACINEREEFVLSDKNALVSGQSITLNMLSQTATPCAWIEVRGKSEKEYEKDAKTLIGKSDTFAIRPDKFTLPSNLVAKAGEGVDIDSKAVGVGMSDGSMGYSEEIDKSFEITISNTNTHCSYDSGDIDRSSIKQFVDGELPGKLNYDEVGELKVKISEIAGREFARIDRGESADITIEPATSTIKFVPAKFASAITFENRDTNISYSSTPYIFYSNDLSKGARWKFKVSALNKDGDVVTNYTPECVGAYAGDLDLDMKLNIKSDGDLTKLISSVGDKPLANIANQDISLSAKIENSSFIAGVAQKSISVNFSRNKMFALAPANVTGTYFKISDKFGANFVSTTNIPTSGITYQYMRAYIQSPVSVVGKHQLKTAVHYETYDPHHNAKSVVASSVSGDRRWSEVSYDPTSTKMKFDSLSVKYSAPNRSIPSNDLNQNLVVKSSNIPEKNVISMGLDDDFKYQADGIYTDVSFIPDSAIWAGKGKTGKTIDTQIARDSGFNKIGW